MKAAAEKSDHCCSDSTMVRGSSTMSASRSRMRRGQRSPGALCKAPGFTGKAPGGSSRWSTERSGEWEPLRPELVVEVRFDHITGDRFRHGTKLMRWRPDKAPRQCTFEQISASGLRESFP
jgi:ATP-dependent DNA ligase